MTDAIRRAGILGGGQLARMLAQAAPAVDVLPVVYAAEANAPAALVAPESATGSMTDEDALRRFFASVDVVTFENEFVDTNILARAAGERADFFRPSLGTIEALQDKLGQKRVLAAARAPHTRWIAPEANEAHETFMGRALDTFGGRAVLKWARLGYDGKGVLPVTSAQDENVLAFCREADARGVVVFAEEFVPFRRELAIVASRGIGGECVAYPLVISEQQRSICRLVVGPAVAAGVDASLEREAAAIAQAIGREASLVGTFAVEFFETGDGRILVNEIAPRVHNSGHYTLDACPASQFENHWRGILGLPLGETRPRGAFAMLNLLGPDGVVAEGEAGRPRATTTRDTHIYWYEKDRVVPGRKVGHINGVADDAAQLPALVERLESIEAEWRASLGASKGES